MDEEEAVAVKGAVDVAGVAAEILTSHSPTKAFRTVWEEASWFVEGVVLADLRIWLLRQQRQTTRIHYSAPPNL